MEIKHNPSSRFPVLRVNYGITNVKYFSIAFSNLIQNKERGLVEVVSTNYENIQEPHEGIDLKVVVNNECYKKLNDAAELI